MKFKGDYSGETTYDVGDVVIDDGMVFILQKAADAGTVCKNNLYWQQIEKPLAEVVLMIKDALGMAQNEVKAVNPDAKTIRLASSTASSVKIFDITVDDSGDLTATEYTTT